MWIAEHWTLPLVDLDLLPRAVVPEDLATERTLQERLYVWEEAGYDDACREMWEATGAREDVSYHEFRRQLFEEQLNQPDPPACLLAVCDRLF